MEHKSKEQLELDLANALIEGEMAEKQPDVAALRRLSPRYEIRTQAKWDPIVEETKRVRTFVREIDDRYDAYVPRNEQTSREGGKQRD
ncbi:hypothetical protein ACFFNY_05320 [Paenibacillus hodogayensis]|uniref:Uncharacterized protein n=1 Tax=Paenibacillus hodogayensis TaxID=279208 RepID=A0ABV5VRT8_9BACL